MLSRMSDANRKAGLDEAQRIIQNSAGYYFAGELVPFNDNLRFIALAAVVDAKRRLG